MGGSVLRHAAKFTAHRGLVFLFYLIIYSSCFYRKNQDLDGNAVLRINKETGYAG